MNNLDRQKQRAEAELAELTRKSNQYFWEISRINEDISTRKMGAGNLYVLEKWRDKQTLKIVGIKDALKSLQGDIYTSKQNYKIILTQYLAAKNTANLQENIEALQSEVQVSSHALDAFLLSKMP